MSLVARHLEANGIPTVVIGSALDVVEHCGVARFVFTDFPLGNPCGHPYARDMQKSIVAQALRLLESATAPRTTEPAPFVWRDDPGWRARYGWFDPGDHERLRALGIEWRQKRKKGGDKPDA